VVELNNNRTLMELYWMEEKKSLWRKCSRWIRKKNIILKEF